MVDTVNNTGTDETTSTPSPLLKDFSDDSNSQQFDQSSHSILFSHAEKAPKAVQSPLKPTGSDSNPTESTSYVQATMGGLYADDSPYEHAQKIDTNQKALMMVDKGALAIAHGEPLDNIPNELLNKSTEQVNQEDVDAAEAERHKVRVGTLEAVAGMDRADLIPHTVAQLQEEHVASMEKAKHAIAPQLARNYNTPGAEHLSDDELVDISIDDYTLNAQAKAIDAQSGWRDAGDILNMMVIPDDSYNAAKLSDSSWFSSQEGMQSLADSRAALQPDQKLMFDQHFKEHLDGIESSEIQKYTELLDVMGKNPDMSSEQWMEKAFIAFDVGTVAKGIVKGLSAVNKMRQLSRLGDGYTTAMSAEVATREGMSAETGIPKVDAAMAGNPLKEDLKDSTLKGTTVTGSSETRTRLQDVDKALDEINGIQGVQILPTGRELNDMASKWSKIYNEMDNVESSKVTKTVDGVNIEYTTPEGTFNKSVEYKMDDFGGFQEKELGLGKTLTRHVWSPSFLQGKDTGELVGSAVVGSFKKAKAVSHYNKAFKAATKGVNRKSLQKISDLLGKLNGKDVDINYHKLVNEGIGGTHLTDKEATSLLSIRRIFDHMHETNNYTMRREMELRGLRGTKIGEETHYAKAYDASEDAKQAYRLDVNNNQVLISERGATRSVPSLTSEQIDELYDQGYKMVKNDSTDQYGWFKDINDNHSRYAFVSRDDVGDLPERVLPYTPNYVPRLRKEANFFVKERVPMKVNGNDTVKLRTVAWAKTEAQANKWLDKLERASEGNPHKEFDRDNWSVIGDREMGSDTAGQEQTVRMNGGLYRGSRSQSGIVYAGDNTTEEGIVDPLNTLQGAMRYTADRMSLSEVRQTLRHRWLQDAGLVDDEVRKVPWTKARSLISDSNASPQLKSKLLSAHDQISNISSIPSKSEQAMQGAIKAIAKAADKRGYDNVARYFYNKGKGSPLDALKGSAFHMMLGAFSPAQYVVQFMGATVAMGANPGSFVKAIPRIMGASLTDLIDDSITHGKAIKVLKDKNLITSDMEQDIQFWRTSGMRESVLKANADFDNSGNFMPVDAGVLRRGFNSLANHSTMFYEAGELGSMRTSFFTALEHMKSLAGGKWEYTEANMQKVIERAEQYRLGMSSANKAEFQKGVLALPTQFKSIYTKSLEAMFGKDFTPAEKARIALTQLGLFGAAGVPFVNHFQDAIINKFAPDGVDPETLQSMKKGSVGWLVSDVWGMDAEVSGRVAVAGDIIQEMEDMMFSKQPFLKSFMGASFTSTDKAISGFMNMFAAGKIVIGDDQLNSYDKVGLMAKYFGYQAAQIPSSTRRLMEAYILQSYKEVRTSTGRTLYSAMGDDSNMQTVVARAMGFSSQEMQDLYTVNQALYNRKDKIRDVADVYLGLMNSITLGVDQQDEKQVEAAQMGLTMLKTSIDNDQDREDINKAILAGMKGRNFKDKTISEWLGNYTSDLLNARGKVFTAGEKQYKEVTEGGNR
jgi:hypothetical protein